MVLVHGIHGHAHAWDTFAMAMRDDYHVVALDLRGHGESQWSDQQDYSGESFVTDLTLFVAQVGLQSVTLVGESLGGIICYGFAGLSPGMLERLVIVDIGPELGGEGLDSIRGSAQGRPVDFADMDEALQWSRGDVPSRHEDELRRRLEHNLIPTDGGRLRWRYDPYVDLLLRQGDDNSDMLWQLWSAIACPTLVVRGGRSELLTVDTGSQMVSRGNNVSLVEVPDAGHAVLMEAPQALVNVTRDFLSNS